MTDPRPLADTGRTVQDASFVAGVARRNGTALEELYRRYGAPCHALARRIVNDDLLAADVVQEIFLSVWRSADRYDPHRGSVASWLLAMTHHTAVDVVRREENLRRRRTSGDVLQFLAAPGPEVADEAWSGLRRERVRSALQALPEAQRQALALAYFGGYTQREIAGLTGLPLGTVKTRMLLGMRRLRDLLSSIDPDEPADDGARS